MFLVDTNILLDYPKIPEKEQIILHLSVLEELVELKRRGGEVSSKARKASYYILKNKDSIVFDSDYVEGSFTDDILLNLAKKKNYKLLTNDINLLIKAQFKKVPASQYIKDEDEYTGIKRLITGIDDEEIGKIYQGGVIDGLFCNQYVFIQNEDEVVDIFSFDGTKLVKVPYSTIPKSQYTEEIKPRNPEQRALINTLNNKDNTIVFATGQYGTGKTMLLTSFALSELFQGNISKIIFVPNNAQSENSREMGILPGDSLDKEIVYMGPIVDMIGDITEVERMYDNGTLEIMPISLARGRNLENCIIIVNEAQNLTSDHIKLLIARCAKNTRIFFDGDIKQTDARVFREKNGLKLLTHLRESEIFSKIFSMVKLESIERSITAQAAQFLSDIE